MTDSYNGFAFIVMSADVNAPGGKRRRQLLVVARNVHDAMDIARRMIPGALFADSGLEVLAKARALGVGDNDARLQD